MKNRNPYGKGRAVDRSDRRPGLVAALMASGLIGACGGEAQNPLDHAVAIATPAVETPTPPRIASQPQPQIVGDGARVMFAVQVEGRGPFGYQWQREGVDIAGAHGPAFVIPAAQRADDGARFRVVVTGAHGIVMSESVRLGVEPAGFHATWSH